MKKILSVFTLTLFMAITSFAGNVELLGAGASFPYPLYSKMFSVYNNQYGTKVNYQSVGSGAGVRQITAKTVDFGASDKFIIDAKLSKIKGELLHVPTALGAVVVSYNLPGKPTLKFNPEVLSEIFLGKIKKWNDPKIVKLNPGVKLSSGKIIVVHRSDGSGTTAVFTGYLSQVSSEWKNKVGGGKSVKWPTGIGAKGNEGVAGNIKALPNSIGYCELAYSIRNKMPQALLKNKAGNFVAPNIASTSAAAAGDIPDDTRIVLSNTDAKDGYPIASFTWLLVYAEQNYNGRDKAKAAELVKLLKWVVTDGQKYNKPLDYAPLSAKAQEKALKQIDKIKFNGQKLSK